MERPWSLKGKKGETLELKTWTHFRIPSIVAYLDLPCGLQNDMNVLGSKLKDPKYLELV